MALVRFRPARSFDMPEVPRQFSDLMNEFFNESIEQRERSGFTPDVNVREDDTHFYIEVSLPGISKEDLKINLDDNTLHISGERRRENKEENVKYHLVESAYGRFERAFNLPENVDQDSINAEFKDGILTLSIEKKQKKVSKEISVK